MSLPFDGPIVKKAAMLPIGKVDESTGFLKLNERTLVLLLCCFAAVHVFIFSSAFPFFNNVDELIHFDLVVKYAHGQVPRGLETISPESSVYLSLFCSLAYLGTPATLPGGIFPTPPWKLPMDEVRRDLALNAVSWQGQENYEVSQPPLYYTLSGFWWRIGQGCGFADERLLYWLRFLNVLVVVLLVWLGYAAARLVFPENLFLRLGVASLLAFMPQTAFYSIENDVLSPLAGGALFICLVQWLRADVPGVRLGVLCGLAMTTAGLSKLTNLPLLAVAGLTVLFKTWQLLKQGKLGRSWPALVVLALCAGLPISAWLAWCKYHFGDWTGAELKIQHFGWTHKSFNEWWSHPIFTPHGLWTFLLGLLATFWQGEFWWHGRPLAAPAADLIYPILSIGLVAFGLLALIPKFSGADPVAGPARPGLWLGFANLAAALAFFGFLSIIYDFHGCANPSRDHPYFTSGRLMLGALIPFMLLFVHGLDRALVRCSNRTKFSVLAGMILCMLLSEIAIDWPVFANDFNWFHL